MPWAAIVSFVMGLVGKIFGIGQAADPSDTANKAGVVSGKAQATAAEAEAELTDIATAKAARESVNKDPAHIKDDDGFRRD